MRDAVFQVPPAFSQSALVMYFENDVLELLPDGLAEGEVVELPEELPEAPGAVVVPPLEPDIPGLLLEPELPDGPLPAWAAAITGARAMVPTKSTSISFCMVTSSRLGVAVR